MKSNYLENIILEISKETEKSSEIEVKNIEEQVKKLDASWKKKYLMENFMLPFIFSIFFLSMYLIFKGVLFVINLIPMLTAFGFIIVIMYQNYKLNKLDLSFDLIQYGNRQYAIYRNQLIAFKWFRWIVYPVMGVTILWELIYYIYRDAFNDQIGVIIFKLIILGGVYWYEKDSVKKLWIEIENLQ